MQHHSRFHRILFGILSLMILFSFALQAEDGILDSVVFFGDSTTAHLASRGDIPRSQVWSGAGCTVLFETVNRTKCVHLSEEDMDVTLADAVRMKKPKYLVITLGVSGGAGFLLKERFVAIYRELLTSVREASPDTSIFVQSILPLSDKSVKYYKRLNRDSVAEANRWISELCATLNIPYINSHDRLTDESGYLRTLYQFDEYMHLTGEAYAVILENVKASIERSMTEKM